jgi:hypothetical protein
VSVQELHAGLNQAYGLASPTLEDAERRHRREICELAPNQRSLRGYRSFMFGLWCGEILD